MKTSLTCPKCSTTRLLHVTEVADSDGEYEVATFKVARVKGRGRAGEIEAYVCRQCGYTEFYTRDPGTIQVDGRIVREVGA